MTRSIAVAEWELVEEDADEAALGPEDYAWFALIQDRHQPERLPRLRWVWDRSGQETLEHHIALAAQGPLGTA